MAGLPGHVVDPDRVDHDPHDREEPEGRPFRRSVEGLPDRHAVDGDRDDEGDREGHQCGPVRLPAQPTQQHEQDQESKRGEDGGDAERVGHRVEDLLVHADLPRVTRRYRAASPRPRRVSLTRIYHIKTWNGIYQSQANESSKLAEPNRTAVRNPRLREEGGPRHAAAPRRRSQAGVRRVAMPRLEGSRPRMEASRTSATWAMGRLSPRPSRLARIWSMQPGFEVTSRSAPVASTLPALRSPSSVAASGCSRL